ncbi:hypothetical protein BEN48_14595 [Hymenobacter glacialis]|uniref:Nucleotidyl transferase AbiEii/AbiGii toxin family protein n=1 Tax=Hymenobacter glacialis TaxID=1908236 RepID=A0A1G1T3D8_9BACT|nr:nucleotidyl transferase AbiEii/AbiGii toxin family protein [Hymenobacter glacialis]OGX85390.1 hypothetical protein BEN48_14595 [Hymenobacter glacialis]
MDIDVVNKIKHLALIALASDDELSEAIVLKGGNAIDLAYSDQQGAVSRTSFDLDFSLADGDFLEDLQAIKDRIERTLVQTYAENGYVVLEYNFLIKPKTKPQIADFWGGYLVEFKVVEQHVFDRPTANPNAQRRDFIPLRPNHSPKFQIEFSKFEYMGAGSKRPIKVGGYTVQVYTAEMIVFEKVRAICQQLPQYAQIIPSHTPRPGPGLLRHSLNHGVPGSDLPLRREPGPAAARLRRQACAAGVSTADAQPQGPAPRRLAERSGDGFPNGRSP